MFKVNNKEQVNAGGGGVIARFVQSLGSVGSLRFACASRNSNEFPHKDKLNMENPNLELGNQTGSRLV